MEQGLPSNTFKKDFIRYKLTISYNGAQFYGLQTQKNHLPTIQDEIQKVVSKLSDGTCQHFAGSGRTDARVHAFEQCITISLNKEMPHKALMKAFNSLLPKEIRVGGVEKVTDFHPQKDAQGKEYRYFFSMGENYKPFQKDLMTHYPYQLNIEKMQKACKLFVGEHDFRSFYTTGTPVSHTIRKIWLCELVGEIRPSEPLSRGLFPPYYYFRFVGNGFLKQMVRAMVGALLEVGREKIGLDDIRNALSTELLKKEEDHISSSRRLAFIAPPEGLYLQQVFYQDFKDS